MTTERVTDVRVRLVAGTDLLGELEVGIVAFVLAGIGSVWLGVQLALLVMGARA